MIDVLSFSVFSNAFLPQSLPFEPEFDLRSTARKFSFKTQSENGPLSVKFSISEVIRPQNESHTSSSLGKEDISDEPSGIGKSMERKLISA